MCLSCETAPSEELRATRPDDPEEFYSAMTQQLLPLTSKAPLQILASAFLAYGADEAARLSLDAYDAFLAILDDSSKRMSLRNLTPDAAANDALFAKARELAARFQEGLTSLFFETDRALTTAAQLYGVF
jgi:hypothetical protein